MHKAMQEVEGRHVYDGKDKYRKGVPPVEIRKVDWWN
jgi:hypothetical protein